MEGRTDIQIRAPRVKDATRLIIGPVRTVYAHLDKPYEGETTKPGEGKYELGLLIPKDAGETVSALLKAEEAALKEKFPKKPMNPRALLRDGAEKGFDGYWLIVAKSKRKVDCFSGRRERLEPSEVYSGCWCCAMLNIFGYDVTGNKGAGAGLNGVQKVADDTPLGGGGCDADDFESYEDQGGDDW